MSVWETKAVERDDRDRLSELPDDLLHRILRFLDMRQVINISSLSQRWRYLWATTPFITLRSGYSASERFGNSLLLLRDGAVPLHTFCLYSWYRENFGHEHRWLRHVVARGLRVLEINLSCRYCFQLPECIFSCATLEEFILSTTEMEFIAPRSVRLPCLKKLHLEFVGLHPSVVVKLNSGCPALEDLSLSRLSIIDCEYDEIHVSAPNICSLRLTVSGKVQLDGMPFLVSAWVYLRDEGVCNLPQGGYNLVAVLCRAQHLELFRFNLLLLDMMESSAHEALSFCTLKSLYIGECQTTDFYGPLAYFLRRAPNLVALTLDQWKLYLSCEYQSRVHGKET